MKDLKVVTTADPMGRFRQSPSGCSPRHQRLYLCRRLRPNERLDPKIVG
jgi:hypothetical protein